MHGHASVDNTVVGTERTQTPQNQKPELASAAQSRWETRLAQLREVNRQPKARRLLSNKPAQAVGPEMRPVPSPGSSGLSRTPATAGSETRRSAGIAQNLRKWETLYNRGEERERREGEREPGARSMHTGKTHACAQGARRVPAMQLGINCPALPSSAFGRQHDSDKRRGESQADGPVTQLQIHGSVARRSLTAL